MLKQRVLTAMLLLPLVMLAIFALPTGWFLFLLALIFLGGSFEYTRLAGFAKRAPGYLLITAQVAIFTGLFSMRAHWSTYIVMVMSMCCVAWLLLFIRLPLFHAGSRPDSSFRVVSIMTAIISITTGWFAFAWVRMQAEGSWLILLLLLIVWAADTGAYFAGKTFGKKKLAPEISPKKTRTGLLGGLIAAPLVALLAVDLMPMGPIEPIKLVVLSLVTALVSAGGDLLISLHKRTSGYKDSGHLLPGHGGVLDRIDSLLAAAPFFALGLLVSGV